MNYKDLEVKGSETLINKAQFKEEILTRESKIVEIGKWKNEFIVKELYLKTWETTKETINVWLQVDLKEMYHKNWRTKG